MSGFRRRLMSISEGSWFRICEGGIYAVNNAYIDTLYNNFTNKELTISFTSKVLHSSSANRAILGAYGNGVYNLATFSSTTETKFYKEIYKTIRQSQLSQVDVVNNEKPFVWKKIRYTVNKNQTSYNDYIDIYDYDDKTITKTISIPSEISGSNTSRCNYNLMIFAANNSGTPGTFCDNISIYQVEVISQGNLMISYLPCQLTRNISASLAWDNQNHYVGEYGMYDEVSGKFFGNANSVGYFMENIDPIYDTWTRTLLSMNCVLYAPLNVEGDLTDHISRVTGSPYNLSSYDLPSDNLTWSNENGCYILHAKYGGNNAITFPIADLQGRMPYNNTTNVITVKMGDLNKFCYGFGIGRSNGNPAQSDYIGYSLGNWYNKPVIPSNRFVTLAIVLDYDNLTVKHYVDGQLYSSSSLPSSHRSLKPNWQSSWYDYITINAGWGAGVNLSNYEGQAYFKECSLFNKALTQEEIQFISNHNNNAQE